MYEDQIWVQILLCLLESAWSARWARIAVLGLLYWIIKPDMLKQEQIKYLILSFKYFKPSSDGDSGEYSFKRLSFFLDCLGLEDVLFFLS